MKLTYSILTILTWAALAVCAVGPFSSTGLAADAAAKPAAPTPAAPTLTDAEKLAVRNAQVDVQQQQLSATQLQQQWSSLQTQMQQAQQKLQEAVASALKAHGLKPEEWQLDKDLALQRVPTPQPSAPAETKK